jgi:hypothetical protein
MRGLQILIVFSGFVRINLAYKYGLTGTYKVNAGNNRQENA